MRYDFRVTPIRTVPVSRPRRRWKKGIALVALLLLPAICIARQFSIAECAEGGDFIKNAALARDSGMSELRFIDKLHEDIQIIQGLPPQLRWFVQDEEDAEFLLGAATNVFRNPQKAGMHQTDFFAACLGRMDDKPSHRL